MVTQNDIHDSLKAEKSDAVKSLQENRELALKRAGVRPLLHHPAGKQASPGLRSNLMEFGKVLLIAAGMFGTFYLAMRFGNLAHDAKNNSVGYQVLAAFGAIFYVLLLVLDAGFDYTMFRWLGWSRVSALVLALLGALALWH